MLVELLLVPPGPLVVPELVVPPGPEEVFELLPPGPEEVLLTSEAFTPLAFWQTPSALKV